MDVAQNDDDSKPAFPCRPLRKKLRTCKNESISANVVDPKPSQLSGLPFELLAEILLHTSSPKDLLAVARCSKYLCDTLVQNHSSHFIWRSVRAACKPKPIPDPTPNFNEPSYAAFLFDGGECDVCKKWTKKTYSSFALRVRTCGQVECRRALVAKFMPVHLMKPEIFSLWLPSIESTRCLFPERDERRWPRITPYYRVSDWSKALRDNPINIYFSEDYYLTQQKPKIDRLPLIMSFSTAVSSWVCEYRQHRTEMRRKNEAIAQAIAQMEGWDLRDLLVSNSYGVLHRNRISILEEVKLADYSSMRVKVETEIMKLVERRTRRTQEKAYLCRRVAVEDHYHRLLSSSAEHPLPTLARFRELPIIKLLQTKTSTKDVIADLKSVVVSELLHHQLGEWREQVKSTLAGLLGSPNWKSPSVKLLHPADRITARFKCSKCLKVARKYQENGCLDFAGVCAHECPNSNKKSGEKEVWSAARFIPDNKAMAAVSKTLVLCGIIAEERGSFDAVKEIGVRIMCLSCTSAIVMGFQSVVSHSQRHDDMQLSLLSEMETASILVYPLEYGLSAKLNGPGSEAKKIRDSKTFGCRHCTQLRQPTCRPVDRDSTVDLESVGDICGPSANRIASIEAKLFTFNGLISHCKTKHGITAPHDEDFFHMTTISLHKSKGT